MHFLQLIFLLLFINITKCDKDLQSENGFLFTVPKALRSGRRETACLSIHQNKTSTNLRANITISIETTGEQHYVVMKKTIDSENVGCFEVRVPETTDTKAMLHLQVKFSETTNYSINSVDVVNIIPNTGFTFIQTDKEFYKPGDRVKIRILILNHDLTIPKNLVIPTVKIRNPIRIAIGQWENVTTELGLVQLEHQLAQETVLGTWAVELQENTGTFKNFVVKEYIPPRFEVIIKHPDSIYVKTKSFNLTVCAKYTYGLAVKGKAHIRLTLPSTEKSINEMKELQDGCSIFTIVLNEIFSKHIPLEQLVNLHVVASVKDNVSNTTESSKSNVELAMEKYVLEFVNTPSYFQKGIPFKGQVRVVKSFEDLSNTTVNICYNFAINQSWNLTDKFCGNFTLDETNSTTFHVFPFDDSIHTIKFHAVINDETNKQPFERSSSPIYLSAPLWYSPSNSYIQIDQERSSTPIKCKAWQPFTILYTLNNTNNETRDEPIEFNYLIKSKGNIVKFGKMLHTPCSSHSFDENDYQNILGNTTNLKPQLPIDKFILTIKILQKMFSEGHLIVYYTRSDGEVVAASIHFHVENCLSNRVEANWSTYQNYPGESTFYKIKAAAGSLCAVSAVDKAVTIRNPPLKLNADILLKHVQKPKIYDAETSSTCKFNFDDLSTNEKTAYWDLRRRKRYYDYSSQFYDALQVFNDADILVMTDLKIITRPCFNPEEYELSIRLNSELFLDTVDLPELYQTQITDMGATVRSFFPDTWLWELVPVGRSGEAQLQRELPHTITQWVGDTICVSPLAGVGISQTNYITSFKPFFVDLITPYAIKRHEVSHLPIIVFNYLNHSLPVRITLTMSDNLRLAGSLDESTISACVGPNESIKDMFRVSALTLGKVNVSITAEVDSTYPGECGPEILLNQKDVLVKTILVQSEGFPFENIKSTFVCMDNNTNDISNETQKEIKWNVELPYDAVANSSRIKILLDTDLLELTMENLGHLLEIPTGCGEQIMAKLAPNLFVLKYLNTTRSLTNYTRIKALNNIRIGYEKILQYQHSDGSFSVFGEYLTQSSTFLTAFVLRTLAQASKFVYIDKNVISNAFSWIVNKQFENGCFTDNSYVLHQSLENDDDNSALTAYVLVSLIELEIPIPEKILNNAKYCLRAHNSLNKYSNAIVTYALTLANWHDEASRGLDRLLEIATRENSLIWWEDPESLPSSLEMTSYVIMSLINLNSSDHIALANSAVRWLLTKRNEHGGFISTQDTVVALDALTKFALATKTEEINMNVSVLSGGKYYNFRISDKAKLKTKQLILTKFSNFIKFKVNGTGCILLQSILRYNMPEILGGEAFKLQIDLSPMSTIDQCSLMRLTPCLSHITPNKHANMAVMEVTLPSGYKADRTSLYELTRKSELHMKKFEENGNKVILYFTKVDSEYICTPFLMREENVVENRMDAAVRLYDYYNPEISTSTSYHLPTCISNSIEQIPNVTEKSDFPKEQNESIDELDTANNYQQDSGYFSENEIETSTKKPAPTGLNPDFIDMDTKLEYPHGVEGPQGVYVRPPSSKLNNL